MTAGERGFLLLSAKLGDPHRKSLTGMQLRQLARRVLEANAPTADRELGLEDLRQLGYAGQEAEQILQLLEGEILLDGYLRRCAKAGCGVLTRLTPGYPPVLRRKLGNDSPVSLWYKGDMSLLDTPMVSLVGSRALSPENEAFARRVGIQAARQGYTLVSGNARGADRVAQNAAVEAGGKVISVLADALTDHPCPDNVLLLSEDGFDCGFSVPRALRRNRIIHSLPSLALVAQSGAETGGTWDGTTRSLKLGLTPTACFDDGSKAVHLLEQAGARLVRMADLDDLSLLACQENIQMKLQGV